MSIVQDFFARLNRQVEILVSLREQRKELEFFSPDCPIYYTGCSCEAGNVLQDCFKQESEQVKVVEEYLEDFYEMLEW